MTKLNDQKKNWKQFYLHKFQDILFSIQQISKYLENMNYEEFCSDRKTRSAVIYELYSISGSSKVIFDVLSAGNIQNLNEINENLSKIPLKEMSIMIETLPHDGENCRSCDEDNYRLIWKTCKNELPAISERLSSIYIQLKK